MKVPFLDLKAHHAPLRAELDIAIGKVIDENAFAGGPHVAEFEKNFASYCGTTHAIGVASGTDALWLTLLALGVGQGDEVITVPMTFMATAEAITFAGAKPVFIDIDRRSYMMDPSLLERAITPRTKAIIPVHLFGQVADMDPILEIANRHGIPVIEDACQAHGAGYKGRRAGALGVAGCFSFYPGKNLGAFGEAGAVTTNDPELDAKIRVLRDHGQPKKYHHTMIGWNGRMDGIQGAVLDIKLKHLDTANAKRRANAKLYDELLGGLEEIVTPVELAHGEHVYHVYAVRLNDRTSAMDELGKAGISSAIHYPIPIHRQEAYSGLELPKGSLPVSEECAEEFLSLPMYPELSAEQATYVAGVVKEHVAGRKHQIPSAKF